MTKLFSTTYFFLFLVVAVHVSVYGQSLDSIPDMFKRYQQAGVHEKLFVHTDKANYLAGETMWFKVYSTDASLNRPLELSKIAYMEILDSTNTPVNQAKIQMCKSSGSGFFKLPVTLISGSYTLRAYTAWMKNFDSDYYYHQAFSILNTLDAPLKQRAAEPLKYDFQLFPEGGELVSGLQSEIAFKLTDQFGNGKNLTGVVLNERNDTLARFKSFKFGMGHFTFTPQLGIKYRAVVFTNDRRFSAAFPRVKDKGYVMKLSEQSDNQYVLKLRSNLDNNPDPKVYILIHTGQLLKVAESIVLTDGKADFVFDKNRIGAGVSHITIFDEARVAVAERLCFVQPKQLNITVTPQNQVYGLRQQVKLGVEVNNSNGVPEAAELSMALFRKDGYSDQLAGNITSYLWLASELKGRIESPEYYFVGDKKAEAVDNLLMTQGWRRFKWLDVIGRKLQPIVFLPEYQGLLINAAVNNNEIGAASTRSALIGMSGEKVQVTRSVSDATGNFVFDIGNQKGKNELVLQLEHSEGIPYKFILKDGYSDQYSPMPLKESSPRVINNASLETGSVSMQVQTLFNKPPLSLAKTDSLAFFGKAKTYLLDRYTRFTTMEEVLREYVAEVNVNDRQKQWHIKMISGAKLLDGDPLLILDGIPVLETNDVIKLDPLKIKKLEVIPSIYHLGQATYTGILSFTSYQNDRKMIAIDPNALVLDYEGLQAQRQFYSPDYSKENLKLSRIPDFRTLLCWYPSLKIDKFAKREVEFYTSDNPGEYYGIIQGISANGETGSSVFSITVNTDH